MKALKWTVRGLAWIAYLLILLLLLTAAPILFGNTPVVVLSGSMRPAYPVGSVTYYKPASFDRIGAGDVITFRIGGSGGLATHRVTGTDRETQSFTTKGDSNDSGDANPVPYSAVKGKTAGFAIPYVGYLVSYVRHWYVIAGCAMLLFLDMLFFPGREKRTEGADGAGNGDRTRKKRRKRTRKKRRRRRPTAGETVLRGMGRETPRSPAQTGKTIVRMPNEEAGKRNIKEKRDQENP